MSTVPVVVSKMSPRPRKLSIKGPIRKMKLKLRLRLRLKDSKQKRGSALKKKRNAFESDDTN